MDSQISRWSAKGARLLVMCVSALCFLLPLAARADITTGLIGHWTLDESSGTTAIDSGSDGDNGTIGGSPLPTYIGGKIGLAALSFPGVSHSDILTSSTTAYEFIQNTAVFTISAWFKLTDYTQAGSQTFMSNSGGASKAGIYFAYYSGGSVQLFLTNSSGTVLAHATTGTGAIADDNWHLATVVGNGSNVQVYIDGTAVGTAASYSGSASGASYSGMYMGDDNSGDELSGALDDIRVYSRALSTSDVSALYAYSPSVSAPVISSIATSTTGVTATITWNTDQPATSTIGYGTTASYGSASTSSSYVTSHSISLSGLATSTTYHIQISSSNIKGQVSTSSDYTITTSPHTQDIYIANSSAGSDTGADCADAHSASWFNTSGNWGNAVGVISPGDYVHLCGTFTSQLTVQAGGTSGKPITIYFEPGAVMTAPVWPVGSINSKRYAIGLNSTPYITIDGGTDGIITSTDNGTNLTNQDTQSGIYVSQSDNVQIENLDITDMYVRQEGSTDPNAADAIDYFDGNHVKINNNTLNYCGNCINYSYAASASSTDVSIYDNTISKASIGINLGSGGALASLDTLSIYGNDISDTNIWDGYSNNHQNGMHLFASQATTTMTNVKIYDNYLHGDIGTQSTAWVFLEGFITGALVHDNLFNYSVNIPSNGALFFKGCASCQAYNNTIISSVSGAGFELQAWLGTETGIKFDNNIVENTGFGIYDDTGSGYLQQALAQSDYNIFYSTSSSMQMGSYSISSWSNWQALNYDAHSTTSDPLLDSNYKPQSGSPAISAGTNLSSYFTTDYAGTARPSTGPWDIGAYEYVAPSNPTVTTQAVSGISTTAVTGNGTITATGGSNATAEGVAYGLTSAYTATSSNSGSFSTGSFTASISGLSCNTTYHIAAFATNPAGTSYGSDTTFTTSACATAAATPVVSTHIYGQSHSSPSVSTLSQAPSASSPSHTISTQTIASLIEVLVQAGVIPSSEATTALTKAETISAPQTSSASFSRNLSLHAKGPDVSSLQSFLNSKGFTVSKTGPGSPGHETS
ncbi:MAG: hypothetical protein KGH68_03510, partial [Patescibacteria group bacterium]|nr:hypothetical protein [Patescibacteria group bacterium]